MQIILVQFNVYFGTKIQYCLKLYEKDHFLKFGSLPNINPRNFGLFLFS